METKKRITLAHRSSVRMEERKSVFIGHASPVNSEAEAREFIDEKRREYHDATHNVYAYIIDGGAGAKLSDDGEPSGTAGQPVFNVLKMSGATDMCVVVTRYFGGILLGAGGLVRAYSASAKLALDAAGLAVFEEYAVISIVSSYSDYGKLTSAFSKIGLTPDSVDYGEKVETVIAAVRAREKEVLTCAAETTSGRAECTVIGYEERASEM